MLRQRFSALLRDRTAMAGAALLGLMIALAVLAPLLGGDPYRVDPTSTLRPPSASHWFGTDEKGRDLWTMEYRSLDASVAYRVNDHLSVGLEGMNLLDEKYHSYSGVEQLTRGAYVSGRRYMASLRFQF